MRYSALIIVVLFFWAMPAVRAQDVKGGNNAKGGFYPGYIHHRKIVSPELYRIYGMKQDTAHRACTYVKVVNWAAYPLPYGVESNYFMWEVDKNCSELCKIGHIVDDYCKRENCF